MKEITIKQLADKVLFRQVNGIVFKDVTLECAAQKIKGIKKELVKFGISGNIFTEYLEIYLTKSSEFDLIIINTDTEHLEEDKRYRVLHFITTLFKEENLISIREYLKEKK